MYTYEVTLVAYGITTVRDIPDYYSEDEGSLLICNVSIPNRSRVYSQVTSSCINLTEMDSPKKRYYLEALIVSLKRELEIRRTNVSLENEMENASQITANISVRAVRNTKHALACVENGKWRIYVTWFVI